MNREQAKIIGQMSDEQLEAVGLLVCRDYVRDIDFIRAYGDGAEIEALWKDQTTWRNVAGNSFGTDYHTLRIATPKITFNGVEIDAPIRSRDDAPDVVFLAAEGRNKVYSRQMERGEIVADVYSCGFVFATHKACQLYCDTHNKMTGVE